MKLVNLNSKPSPETPSPSCSSILIWQLVVVLERRSMSLAKAHRLCKRRHLQTMLCSECIRCWICFSAGKVNRGWTSGQNDVVYWLYCMVVDTAQGPNLWFHILETSVFHLFFWSFSHHFAGLLSFSRRLGGSRASPWSRSVSPKRWYNVIDATPNGIICLEADLTSQDADVRFQWTGGQIIINRPPWSNKEGPLGGPGIGITRHLAGTPRSWSITPSNYRYSL